MSDDLIALSGYQRRCSSANFTRIEGRHSYRDLLSGDDPFVVSTPGQVFS